MRFFGYFTLALASVACAASPQPDSQEVQSPSAAERRNTSAEEAKVNEARRLARELDPQSKHADADIATIVASGDPMALERVNQTLFRYYTWINSPDWQAVQMNKLDAANRAAGLDVGSQQLQGQFETWRAKHQYHARRLLFQLGQVSVVKDALVDASNTKLARAARLLALEFLEQDAPGIASNTLAWASALRKELNQPLAGGVANAAQVIAALRELFRDCYQASLEREPSGRFRYSTTIQVDQEGAVSSVSTMLKEDSSQEDSLLTACVEAVARSAKFAKPQGGSAVIKLPLSFEPTQ